MGAKRDDFAIYKPVQIDYIIDNIFKISQIDKNNKYWFIDWEWASNRTEYYDLVLFFLFSNIPIMGLKKYVSYAKNDSMLREIYYDSILISLRELNNWSKINEYKKKSICIEYWKDVVKESILCLESRL